MKADAKYVFFDESGQNRMVIAQINEKSGWGDGAPGEYASFWYAMAAIRISLGSTISQTSILKSGSKSSFPPINCRRWNMPGLVCRLPWRWAMSRLEMRNT